MNAQSEQCNQISTLVTIVVHKKRHNNRSVSNCVTLVDLYSHLFLSFPIYWAMFGQNDDNSNVNIVETKVSESLRTLITSEAINKFLSIVSHEFGTKVVDFC